VDGKEVIVSNQIRFLRMHLRGDFKKVRARVPVHAQKLALARLDEQASLAGGGHAMRSRCP